MSYRIRAVEHRVSAGGLAGAQPGLKNRILLNIHMNWECA